MSIQPPKIDKRTYEDIVEETVKLVQVYTATQESVDNKAELLRDRILAQDIQGTDGKIIATSCTLINEQIANVIANLKNDQIKYLEQVNLIKIKGWWKPEKPDAGLALIRIFGRMAATVSDRLNRVPEKNFLAFLDLLGTQILPPQPARVPLTFSLASGVPENTTALVPAYTQISVSPAEGEEEEVVFETESDLLVTPVQLKAVFVRQPSEDKYSEYLRHGEAERTLQATSGNDAFLAFAGDTAIEHSLYLACDALFTLPEPKTITIAIHSPEAAKLSKLPTTWSYWNGVTWGLLSPTPTLNENQLQLKINSNNLSNLIQQQLNGVEAAWLRASLNPSILTEDAEKEANKLIVNNISSFDTNDSIQLISDNQDRENYKVLSVDLAKNTIVIEPNLKCRYLKGTYVWFAQLPSVSRITVSAKIEPESKEKAPDRCFFNTVPIDLSKNFYPFGEQPRFNDTFYIAIGEVFANPQTQVTVKIKLSSMPPMPINPSSDLKINWEVCDGNNWQWISDLNYKFTEDKDITITLPANIAPTTVGGENRYWVRARIVQGNYGTDNATQIILGENVTVQTDPSKSQTIKVNSVQGITNDSLWIGSGSDREAATITSIDFSTNTLTLQNPLTKGHPLGTKVLLRSVFGPPSVQSLTLSYTYNSEKNALSACLIHNDFKYIDCKDKANQDNSWSPFTATEDKNSTLYLGFNKPFPNRAITLYFQVETPTAKDLSAATTNLTKPRLVWEYFNGQVWTKLSVIDETAAFSDRGLIKFIGPSDFTATQEFNQTLYWLRVRWEKGEFRVPPRLRRILTNTIWASQTTTLQNEILGFSNGNPNQKFSTVQSPILPGQQLEVQEQKIPSPEEQIEIEKLEGKQAITIVRNDTGQVETVWVRWHEVSDFYQSGRRDRHYTINRLTGEIQFGDGKYGLIPPQGRNNIRMARYKTDGGAKGNKPAQTVTQLKTSIPFINSVTNVEPAGGGADQEPIERVKERGPKFIRHRNRAVTAQDFEDLAYEASPDVARAKAIAPICNPLAKQLWLEPKNPNFNLENHQKLIQEQKTNPGLVKLFIVPGNAFPQPIPSLALIERVENYLRDRASPTLNLWVGSPKWLEVSVTAEVVPTSLEFADAVRTTVIQRLETFLHPLTGGVSGQGWEFGREPHESDFYALIESIDRVDYVRSLSVKIEPELPKPPEPFLIFSGSHNITLFLSNIGG